VQGGAVVAVLAVGLCLAAAISARADGDAPATVTVTPLGPVQPGNAPGQALYLLRYTIAPGTKLPLHHHEGTQIGLVLSGALTYRVVSGEVPVFRTAAGGKTELVRTVRAGETARIGAGEWVVEEPEDRHWGANEGTEPVLIVTSALLRDGAPLATRD
jgi:quercetin dioxygenase-like cupin family protein